MRPGFIDGIGIVLGAVAATAAVVVFLRLTGTKGDQELLGRAAAAVALGAAMSVFFIARCTLGAPPL